MSYELKSASALSVGTCRYAGSRLSVRGPKRDLSIPYIAFVGGTEVFGRYVETPFSAVSEELLGMPCVNLGAVNAGIDALVTDPDLLQVAQDADMSVIQLMGAQNMSNRFYRVHPRRNDRFLAAHSPLKELFPEVDFTEFHFNKHLLSTLRTASNERFEIVAATLRETWVSRMTELLSGFDGQVLLLWLRYDLVSVPSFSSEPVLIDRKMVEALKSHVHGILELDVSTAGATEDIAGMAFGEMELPTAKHQLGPKEHRRIGCSTAEKLQPLLKRLTR